MTKYMKLPHISDITFNKLACPALMINFIFSNGECVTHKLFLSGDPYFSQP